MFRLFYQHFDVGKINYEDREEGVANMAQVLERLKKYEIPPNTLKELGLEKNWTDNVSTEFIQKVIRSVSKYEKVLKKLSDK